MGRYSTGLTFNSESGPAVETGRYSTLPNVLRVVGNEIILKLVTVYGLAGFDGLFGCKGGLLLQNGLMGSIDGRFEATILNPTSDKVWLRPRSPVGRMYTVDVINRNPEHIVEFQDLYDGLRVTMEHRQVTAFTRGISNQYDQNTQATDPQEHEWKERVNIGTIPSANQHQLAELLRSHQHVFAQDADDVG